MARPRIEIDKDQFIFLCELHCTLIEFANFFHCSIDTVERWSKRELGMSFADAFNLYSAGGKTSLRRAQFDKAMRGSTRMQIWLGRQLLGQSEHVEPERKQNDLLESLLALVREKND